MNLIRLDREFTLSVTRYDFTMVPGSMTVKTDYPWVDVRIGEHPETGLDIGLWLSTEDGLTAALSFSLERDGRLWQHVSISRPDRLPTYKEMCDTKDQLIGPDKKAIQVFAPKSEHVNIHPYCLHLWHCVDEDVLPDFRKDRQV